jgi:hypothetical protein
VIENWLNEIRDDVRINHLAIPGTHDAASFVGNTVVPALTITQQFNIPEQLNSGVRVLDMRVAHANSIGKFDILGLGGENIFMCHGQVVFSDTLRRELELIGKWLDENPSEFVAMIFQQQGLKFDIWSPMSPSGQRSTNMIAKVISDAFPEDRRFGPGDNANAWPTVGDLRGKVMVFSRLLHPVPGTYDLSAWNQPGQDMKSAVYDITAGGLKVAVQDQFEKVTNCDLRDFVQKNPLTWREGMNTMVGKVNAAKFLLFEGLNGEHDNENTLKINHLSHSLKSGTYLQPYQVGHDLNVRLRASLENPNKRYRGFVMIDDADDQTCRSIVDSNLCFRKDTRPKRLWPFPIPGK